MVSPHHLAHWYPTAAYLYILWLDTLAYSCFYGNPLLRIPTEPENRQRAFADFYN